MKFKFLNYLSIFLIQAIVIGQNNKIESLDQRKFIAWEVHHMPYHILVEDAIIDFNDLNRNSTKVDTFKTIYSNKTFVKVKKLRKRIKCYDKKNKKFYLFNPIAKIGLIN